MADVRDYAAEYRRRIERGLAKGLTRSHARGHAGAKDLSTAAVKFDPKLDAALRQLRRQRASSVNEAAKEAGVSRERLSRYIKSAAGGVWQGRIWRFNDLRIRRLAIVEAGNGRPVQIRVRGFEAAHLTGLHAYEAGKALNPDDTLDFERRAAEFRRRWEGQRVRGVDGRWHTLSTDLNDHLEAKLSHDYSFERFYKIEM